MKPLLQVFAAFGIALVVTSIHPVCAKDAPKAAAARAAEGNLPAVKYNGKNAVMLSYGELIVTLALHS